MGLKGGPMNESTVCVCYKNWRGETSWRTIIPERIYFGSNEYHQDAQWLMEAWDIDKQATRHFALLDILSWKKGLDYDERSGG